MITIEQLQHLKELFDQSNNIVILIGTQTSSDIISAASGLQLALRESGKDVLFAGPEELVSPPEYVTGLEYFTTSLGNRNLVISFDYTETAVENVSYHIGEETGKFFLTVKPQKGYKPLDASTVEFAYAGVEADLIILVGVSSYEALGDLYISNEQLFADTTVISLHTYETEVGTVKLDASGEPGLSSAVARILKNTEQAVSSEAATNLLAGIEQTTDNFKSLATTADTLELAAWLMRSGARRVWRGNKDIQQSPSGSSHSLAEVFSKQSNGEQAKPATVKKQKKNKSKIADEPAPGDLDYQPGSLTTI